MKICICGGGNLGHVVAGFVAAQKKHEVCLLTRHPEQWSQNLIIEAPAEKTYLGHLKGSFSDAKQAVSDADIILLCLPGYAIRETLLQIKDYLRTEAAVGSVVSSTGFFFEAMKLLPSSQSLFGFQRVPFISRLKEYGRSADLLGYKPNLNIAIEQTNEKEALRAVIEQLFKVPIKLLSSYYEVSLTNSNPLLHPSRLYSLWKDWHEGETISRVPLFYEEYPGSITDVSQFRYMVDKVIEYDYKKIGFILDRGYFSKENIMYMDGNNYPFIIMVKGCKVLVSSIVEKNLHTFETDRDCSIRAYKVYGKTVFGRLYEDDVRDRYFHIYFNPSRQAGEREKLEQMLDKYKLMFKKHEGMEACFGKPCEEFFTLKYDRKHRFLYAEEKKDVIKKALNLCGYFCIVTSEEMTAEEALIKYKGRDISEKLFRADKSYIDSKSMRVHSSEAVSAKIFVEFVALIVRNRLYNLLKEAIIRMESDPKYMTVPAALRELEKIEMVQRSKGLYRLDHAITKKQKIILSSFGLDESIVRSKAVEIGRQLADSNFHVQTEEDDENGENEIDLYD